MCRHTLQSVRGGQKLGRLLVPGDDMKAVQSPAPCSIAVGVLRVAREQEGQQPSGGAVCGGTCPSAQL